MHKNIKSSSDAAAEAIVLMDRFAQAGYTTLRTLVGSGLVNQHPRLIGDYIKAATQAYIDARSTPIPKSLSQISAEL